MKIFLKKLGFFVLIMLLVTFLFDSFVSSRIKKSGKIAHGEYDVWNDIYSGKINSDLVIYGSSRAWVQIDPALLAKAFNISVYNLGIDGHKFRMQNFRHKELLKYNKQPKTIIYSLDYFTLGIDSDSYNYDQFLPYMLGNIDILKATFSNNYFNVCQFLLPSLRYFDHREIIDYAFDERNDYQNEVHRQRGYGVRNLKWNDDLKVAKQKMGEYSIEIDSSSLVEFEHFLNECNEKKMKVILVYTPEYIEGQHFEKNRKEIMQLYNNISQKFHIEFLDYSRDSICFNKKYFYNSTHMNRTGSILFTTQLIKDLSEKNLIKQ